MVQKSEKRFKRLEEKKVVRASLYYLFTNSQVTILNNEIKKSTKPAAGFGVQSS